jgi:hypothetical protein
LSKSSFCRRIENDGGDVVDAVDEEACIVLELPNDGPVTERPFTTV